MTIAYDLVGAVLMAAIALAAVWLACPQLARPQRRSTALLPASLALAGVLMVLSGCARSISSLPTTATTSSTSSTTTGTTGCNALARPPRLTPDGITAAGCTPTAAPSQKKTTISLRVAIPDALQSALASTIQRRIDALTRARRASLARAHRSPHYVSPASAGVSVVVTQGSTTVGTYTYDVSSDSSDCTHSGASRTCAITFELAAGTYSLAMKFYDQKPSSGVIPSSANLLSEATTSTTIVADTNNVVTFDLEGVIAGLSGLTFTSVPNGEATETALAIAAVDADGNPIVADAAHPYANPITVTLTSGTTHGKLLKNGASAGDSATLSYSTDTVAIYYDGTATGGVLTAQIAASGASTQVADVAPMIVSVSPASSLAFTAPGQTQTVTVTEADAPATNAYKINDWACEPSGSATKFTAATSGSGTTYTVAITAPSAVSGSTLLSSYGCSDLTITDSSGTTMTSALSSALAFSSDIPTDPVCSSSNSNLYLGAQSSGKYEVSTGAPCQLTATYSVTVYAPPNDSSHPATASASGSEAQDATAPTISDNCVSAKSGLGTLAVAGSLAGALAGNASIASITPPAGSVVAGGGTETCVATIGDGNGQTQPVAVTVKPTVQSVNVDWDWVEAGCSSSGGSDPVYDCTSTGGPIYGGGGTSLYTFDNATNAAAITMNITPVNDGLDCSESGNPTWDLDLVQGSSTWKITGGQDPSGASFSGVVKLPNGAGSYSLELKGAYGCSGGGAEPGNFDGKVSLSLVTAANGSGTITPSARRAQPRKR